MKKIAFILTTMTELSLTVPITNSLAFLFTVLGEWWAEGKVISRGNTLGSRSRWCVADRSVRRHLDWYGLGAWRHRALCPFEDFMIHFRQAGRRKPGNRAPLKGNRLDLTGIPPLPNYTAELRVQFSSKSIVETPQCCSTGAESAGMVYPCFRDLVGGSDITSTSSWMAM